jgi:hypothetical protein
MIKGSKANTSVMPSVTPDDADITAWQSLSRDEQVRRLRAHLAHPDCSTVSPQTMQDILLQAKARAASNAHA